MSEWSISTRSSRRSLGQGQGGLENVSIRDQEKVNHDGHDDDNKIERINSSTNSRNVPKGCSEVDKGSVASPE